MSYWTHIVGVMHVDTYTEVDDVQKLVEDALKNAPQITGSEGPAAVFVKHSAEFGFKCDSPKGFVCPMGEYQTRAVITVCGDLRDRMRSETRKEWNAFHRFIAHELGYTIRNATCRIESKLPRP